MSRDCGESDCSQRVRQPCPRPSPTGATLTSRGSGYTLPSGDRLSLPHSSVLVHTCYLCDVDF
jgi:hypothetical protein